MRREPRALVDLVQNTFHRILDRAHRDALAAAAEEKRGAIPRLTNRTQQLVSFLLVVSERQLRVIADWNDAFLPSLAAHFHLLRQEVDVHATDAAQLRQPHPRRVEQLQNRAVSHIRESPLLRLELGGLEKQFDLRAIEIAREIFLLLRSVDAPRRIRLDELIAVEILVEAPHCG